jgi:hypothetical protein
LPPAVILKRFATDFFVLIPFGRRINSIQFPRKERAIYGRRTLEARGIFRRFDGGNNSLDRPVSVHPLSDVGGWGYLPSVMLEGKPFSQLLGESQGLAERLSDSAVAQPVTLHAAATSSNAKSQYLTLAFFTFPPRLRSPAVVYWFSVVVKASTGQDLGCAGVTTSPS